MSTGQDRRILACARHPEGHGTHAEEIFVILVSIAVAVTGWMVAYNMYIKNTELPQKIGEKFKPVYNLLYNKYWIDELYSKIFIQPILKISDRVILGSSMQDNRRGSQWCTGLIGAFSGKLRKIQTGLLSNYGLVMAVGALAIIGI